jgi:hypothetical protein
MEKEETQKTRDRQAKAKAFYAEQGKANPDSDVAYSKLSPEQKEARHDIFKSIPFIGQAAKAADAGAEGLRQVGKYGKDIDPRLAALENLGGKSAMSPDEMSSAWDSKVGGALSAIKKIPGLSMTTASIRAGEADKLADKMQAGKLGQKQKEDVANIAKRNYSRLSPLEKMRLKTSERFTDDAAVEEYLDNATRGTRSLRGVPVDPRLSRLLGATYPDTQLDRTGGTPRGKLGDVGYAGFDPENNEGSMLELLRNAYR